MGRRITLREAHGKNVRITMDDGAVFEGLA